MAKELDVRSHCLARMSSAWHYVKRNSVINPKVTLVLYLVLVNKYGGMIGKILGEKPALTTNVGNNSFTHLILLAFLIRFVAGERSPLLLYSRAACSLA
jgi:hypothetical protein